LFHFTPKLEFLKGILSEGFRYAFLTEEIPFGGYMESQVTVTSSVKAVCFCDIPLSQSGEHRHQYGQYALAMDREWGMTVGVTPVRYIHPRSSDLRDYTAKKFIELDAALRAPGSDIFTFYMRYLQEIGYEPAPTEDDLCALPQSVLKLLDLVSADYKEMFGRSFGLMALSRLYAGPWTNREQGRVESRVFYDEREWRDIAPADATANLTFKLQHVNHIIVSTASEATELVGHLMTLRDDKHLDFEGPADVWSRLIISDKLMKDL
jgi:Mg2+ and Co2+ transporter CorA